MTSLKPVAPWYVAQGKHGQELLDSGRVSEAIGVFETVLHGLGDETGYGRAVVLERLGRALLVAGDHERALLRLRESLEMAGRLAPTDAVHRLRCSVRSAMGDALRAGGRTHEARRSYLAALELGRELRDVRSQGIDEARLGALALAGGDTAEALGRYRASLKALRQLKEPAVEAAAWDELGRLHHRLGDWAEAVRHSREAVECERLCGASLRLARRMVALAELLRERPEGVEEAAQRAAEALAIAQRLSPTAPEAWAAYGVFGEIHPERGELRELARRAPVIVATAERLQGLPGLGRAVLFARLGRCFVAGGRPDLAATYLQQAIGVAGESPESNASIDLLGLLWTELGEVLASQGRGTEAAAAFASSLRTSERSRDVLGQARARERLGRAEPVKVGDAVASGAPVITVWEDTATDYAFDPNLLLDGPRTRRLVETPAELPQLPDDMRPLLFPSTRTWVDPEGRLRFAPPASEPLVLAEGECTVLRWSSRDVTVSGELDTLWRLLALMDGRATWGEILDALPPAERVDAARVVAELAAAGVVDISDRPLGHFIHWATRKGVLPAGGMEGDEALRLAAEARLRSENVSRRIPLGAPVPERLQAFHALTRSRRSTREYRGGLGRDELDALLATACGVTGAIRWPAGEVRLRAYPSSGALYAVGIYPVVFRIDGLEPGPHRYDPDTHALEVLGPPVDPARFVRAALPMEREMMAGAALMVCLTGVFPRHERKYGAGGYRMLVAEAGHVSQNLVLAATALGLNARPFGGVFDSLVDQALGLDTTREQFLLSVLVGR